VETSGHRVLVLAFDPLSDVLAGPAIRAWNLGLQLSSRHEVTLAGTAGATRRHTDMRVIATDDRGELRRLMEECDAVFAPTSVITRYRFFEHSDKPLCIDMYIPTHLENLEKAGAAGPDAHRAAVRHQVDVLNADLRRGDFFLCASERQRDFWLGALGSLGRINPETYGQDPTLAGLIDIVPFGLDPVPPPPSNALRDMFPAIEAHDPVVVWGGGVYNWFDPLSLVAAVDRLRRERPNLRLVFLGLSHPNPDIPETRMTAELRSLSDHLGLTGKHVFFNEGWVPYDERGAVLAGADVGVSTHLAHIETRFSFRTRILDYLWAGLPMVLTGGDTLSEAVAAAGVGVSVGPGDVDGIATGLARMLDEPPAREAVRTFGRSYEWAVVAEPLMSWMDAPRRAADGGLVGAAADTAAPPPEPFKAEAIRLGRRALTGVRARLGRRYSP
jgi:glycosyltransferase involved in cell wall biosynthesis